MTKPDTRVFISNSHEVRWELIPLNACYKSRTYDTVVMGQFNTSLKLIYGLGTQLCNGIQLKNRFKLYDMFELKRIIIY